LSSSPRYWEIIKRRVADRSTGISPLRGSLRAAPTCYDGFTARLYDRAGVSLSPFACFRRVGGNLTFIADCSR